MLAAKHLVSFAMLRAPQTHTLNLVITVEMA